MHNENKEGYRTCSLSYGAKTLADEDLKVYRDRIEDLKHIVTIKNPDIKNRKTTKWLMRCVSEPATRREGLLDLNRPSQPWSRMQNDTEPEFWRHLTTEHIHELLVILEASIPVRHGLPYEVPTIMSILSKHAQNEDLKDMVRRYREIPWADEERDEKQKSLLTDFLKMYRNQSNHHSDPNEGS